MYRILILIVLVAVGNVVGITGAEPTVRLVVRGETNLRSSFAEDFKNEAKLLGLATEIVDLKSPHDYLIVIAQESSLGGAAAAVIALDGDDQVVASVVRSGRFSGKGAMSACTKELAKRIAILRR